MVTASLEDVTTYFLPQRKSWARDSRTWIVLSLGREVYSHTDYLLRTYRRLFQNVSARDSWHNSDHYMLLDTSVVLPIGKTPYT